MRPLRTALFLLLCTCVLAQMLPAQERILSFDSELTLTEAGTMLVRETITVVAEGDDIERGIYRELDKRRRYNYEVISVTRDGQDEPFKVQKKDGRLRVRIGDKNTYLDPGTYTYVIDYRAKQRIMRLEQGTDEFTYQITGTRWKFPIESVSATLRLPAAAEIANYSCYTGERNSQVHDCVASTPGPQTLVFKTTTPLDKKEGLTIAVAFQPEVFATQMPPPPPAPWKREAGLYVLVIGLLAYLYYAYESWSRHGRDPIPPRIGQQFAPPDGLSAGSVGYLLNSLAPVQHFTASLIALATKGYLTLEPEETKGLLGTKSVTYHLVKTDQPVAADLPEEEALLYDKLFATSGDVRLSAKYDKQLGKIRTAHGKVLQEQHNAFMWAGSNWKLALPLAGIYLVTAFGSLFFAKASNTPNFMAYAVGFTILGMIGLCGYFYLIGRPSPEKQRLLLELKSFRKYLKMSEADRRRLPSKPEMTVAHYEELLPYAIALGINTKWSSYFGDLLAEDRYSPAYAVGAFSATSFNKQFQTAVSSTVSDPNGTMSGGGGSVGGGGGGGGGGGW